MDNPEKLARLGTQDEDNKRNTICDGQHHKQNTNQKHNTICVGHHYTQTNINNVKKTRVHLLTTGGINEPNVVLIVTALCSSFFGVKKISRSNISQIVDKI